jgi:hypothetical protein
LIAIDSAHGEAYVRNVSLVPQSTINTGRRIMAERGRKRGKRARRVPPVVRRAATASIDAPGDEALRALVRILARQAARECFELELKQRSRTIQ